MNAATEAGDLYGQELESRLLSALLARLDNRTVVDVGAERGSFTLALLEAGAEEIYAIEPEPGNVEALCARFSTDARVHIRPYAASANDGELILHRAVGSDGVTIPFGHTVLERPNTDEIGWPDSVMVAARSLGSLVAAKEIPASVGILKIDTEGHDLAVVRGMGDLEADVVMVEHWLELPHSLGRCPWTGDEMRLELGRRGFSHFAFVVHHGELTTLRWDDATVNPGEMGNLVFIHERVLERLTVEVLSAASELSTDALSLVAKLRAAEDEFACAAAERLELVERLQRELDGQAKAAEERREALGALRTEYQGLAAVAAERLEAYERLADELELVRRDRDEQERAAAERLELIEQLERERNQQMAAAEERLRALEAYALLADELELVRRDRDEQARAAAERLELIEQLERERNQQMAAAEERLKALEELRAEVELRQHALDELAARRAFG